MYASWHDRLDLVQLTIQEALKGSSAETLQFFSKKDAAGLRHRLAAIERNRALGKDGGAKVADAQRLEVLQALEKMGDTLSADEKAFVLARTKNMSGYHADDGAHTGAVAGHKQAALMSHAGEAAGRARKMSREGSFSGGGGGGGGGGMGAAAAAAAAIALEKTT